MASLQLWRHGAAAVNTAARVRVRGGASRAAVATPQPCRRCTLCEAQQQHAAVANSSELQHSKAPSRPNCQASTRSPSPSRTASGPAGKRPNGQVCPDKNTKHGVETHQYIHFTLSSQYRRQYGFKCSRQDGKPSQVGSVHTFALSVFNPHWGGRGGTSTCTKPNRTAPHRTAPHRTALHRALFFF